MSKDLWPQDLRVSETRAPVSILREQVAFLERNTDNIVSAVIKSSNSDSDQAFSYNFYITAPSLGSYRYLLLGIFHGFELYPVTIFLEENIKEELGFGSQSLIVNNEEEFEDCLAKIFGSSKARKVVTGLLTQVDQSLIVPF